MDQASRVKRGSLKKWGILGVALLIGAAIAIGYLLFKPATVVPSKITKAANYAIFYAADKNILNTDRSSFFYNSQTQVVSFKAFTADKKEIVFSEQATPGSFIDVPQAYDKLIASLQNYSNFDSINGKVSLTNPKNLNGGQAAIMNSKGTLLFARSQANLSDNDWRRIFNDLQVAK